MQKLKIITEIIVNIIFIIFFFFASYGILIIASILDDEFKSHKDSSKIVRVEDKPTMEGVEK